MRRLCLEPGCPEPPLQRGRCRVHAHGLNRASRARRTHRSVYSTKRWRLTRRAVLSSRPLCSCGAIATEVDHVQPLDRGGQPYARSNLQSLCKSCHSRKTRREMAA